MNAPRERKRGPLQTQVQQQQRGLPQDLQQAIGNAQTVVAFRLTPADGEVLARVWGQVDLEAIKRLNQTEVQHPIYSPMHEQWEGFVQSLTTQAVRQAMVKTADDRLAVIWPEKVSTSTCTVEELEEIITNLLQLHGVSKQEIQPQITGGQKQEAPLFTR